MIKEYASHDSGRDRRGLSRTWITMFLWKMVAEIHGSKPHFLPLPWAGPLLPMKNFAMYLKHFGYRRPCRRRCHLPRHQARRCALRRLRDGRDRNTTSEHGAKSAGKSAKSRCCWHDGGREIHHSAIWPTWCRSCGLPAARRAQHA